MKHTTLIPPLFIAMALMFSCGPNAEEIAKKEKAKADSLAVVQKLREDSIKQSAMEEGIKKAEEEQKKKEEIQAMKDELHKVNSEIHEIENLIPAVRAELEVAKANLTEAKRVKLLESQAARDQNIRKASKKVSEFEQSITTLQQQLIVSKKRKAELEKIVGPSDYSEMEFD